MSVGMKKYCVVCVFELPSFELLVLSRFEIKNAKTKPLVISDVMLELD